MRFRFGNLIHWRRHSGWQEKLCKIMVTRKPTTHIYKDGSVASPRLPQPTRLTLQKLEEKREKGICYSCDRKYSKGHKCAEKKLFYIDCEEEEEFEK